MIYKWPSSMLNAMVYISWLLQVTWLYFNNWLMPVMYAFSFARKSVTKFGVTSTLITPVTVHEEYISSSSLIIYFAIRLIFDSVLICLIMMANIINYYYIIY